MIRRWLSFFLCALALLAAAAPGAAYAASGSSGSGSSGSGSDREARKKGRCSSGASSMLRLRSRYGSIRIEFVVNGRRSGEAWRVALVHERRVAWRGTVRTSDGSLRVRRSYEDYEGADNVMARATGPRGITCRASATLRG